MTLDGRVQLSGDVVVQRGKKLTLTDNARIYSEASGDRLATGKDTTLVEMAVLGLIESNGAVFSSSRDPAFDHYLDDQQPGPQAGDHYGLRFDNLVATRVGYGYTGVEGGLSEIRGTEFKYGEKGLAIEGQAAPSLSGLSFTSILGDQHIFLDSTDVFLPYAVRDRACSPDTCWTQTQTIWDLDAGTHVVAADTVLAGGDASIGTTGKVDQIVQGKLFAQGASGDTVFFRPATTTNATADNWGGVFIDQSNAKGGYLGYTDISYAVNPLFVFYPDSSWAIANSRVHQFADIGIWVQGAVGSGGAIDSSTIERGAGLDLELGLTGIFLDQADEMKVKYNKVDLSGLQVVETSAAIEGYFGKQMCEATPSETDVLRIKKNWVVSPDTSAVGDILGTHSGIYSHWLCGSDDRTIEVRDNYIDGFNYAGMEFGQTSDVLAECNTLVRGLRGVEVTRDSVATGPAVKLKSNWFEVLDEVSGAQVVRTDNIRKTKLGPSQSDRGDNALMVISTNVDFIQEDDTTAPLVAQMDAQENYWYLWNDTTSVRTLLNDDSPAEKLKITSRLSPGASQIDFQPPIEDDTDTTFCHEVGPPGAAGAALARPGVAVGDARQGRADLAQGIHASGIVPAQTFLGKAVGNPSRGSVLFDLGVAVGQDGKVVVEVFDVRGRRVARLVDAALQPGSYRLVWSGTDGTGSRTASGVYFVRMRSSSGFVATRKVILIR